MPQRYLISLTFLFLTACSAEIVYPEWGSAQSFRTASGECISGWTYDPELGHCIGESDPSSESTMPQPSRVEPNIITSGTGFYVSATGHILTNHHVIDQCRVVRTGPGSKNSVAIVATDRHNDLALLKSSFSPAKFATFRTAPKVRAGEDIMVVGYPLQGLLSTDAKVTKGSVSALAGLGDDSRMYQITAPVQPGNSGAPLLDKSGTVIGMVVSKLNVIAVAKVTGDIPQNVNFAIKGELVRAFLDARGIRYQATTSQRRLEPADIAEIAKEFTIPIECMS